MFDVIVIGRGPAGLSAAIYAVRAGQTVLVVARDDGQVVRADKVDNYYGFAETTSGPELQKNALAQARRLGVSFAEGVVTGIEWEDTFRVTTADASWESHAVVLATGMPKRRVRLAGIEKYEGKGVSYCATCDGFFYRGENGRGRRERGLRAARTDRPAALRGFRCLAHERPAARAFRPSGENAGEDLAG